jgi:hypothetical protein
MCPLAFRSVSDSWPRRSSRYVWAYGLCVLAILDHTQFTPSYFHTHSHTVHPELLSHTFSHSSNVPLGRMEDSVLRQMGELSMHRREVLLTLPGR